MPAPVAVPLLVGAVTSGATLYAAKKGADASRNAAATQTAAADRAGQLQYDLGMKSLDFQRQMWDQGQANMQPWMNMGRSALGALGAGMGLSGGGAPAMGGPSRMPSGGMGQGGYSAPAMVMMQAPNGQSKQVPQAMVEHYKAMGARVVG